MSPIVRGIIILAVVFINGTVFFLSRRRGDGISKRCHNYLYLQALFFPVIDLSMNTFGSPYSCFGMSSLLFLVINHDIFSHIDWKRQRLITILLFVSVLSAVLSGNAVNSLLSIPGYLIGFTVYLSAYIAFSDEKYSNNAAIIKLLKLPVLYIIAWGLVQILVSPDFSLYNSVWHKEVRVSSCLREPQTAGIAIAMLFMLSWNYLLSTKNNTMVVICLLLFGIGCFTGTKTFFLGTGAAMVMSVFWVRHKSKLLIAVCMLTILAIICFNYWIDFPIFERLFEMEQSLNFRQEVYWAYAVEIFNDNWLTGIGPGNFQDYVESAKIPLTHFVEGEYVYASQPESGYLLWLDELGIMAVVWLLMIVYVCTRRGNHIINISLLIPWMVGFVSVYNFISMHIVFLAFLVAAIMVKSNNFKES